MAAGNLTPPAEVVDLATQAVEAVRGGGLSDVSSVGLQVAEAITGWQDCALDERYLRAMTRQTYAEGTINAALFGDQPGARWAAVQLNRLAAVRDAESQARSLPALSAKLREADRRFRDRAEAALTAALNAALRFARAKADVRYERSSNGRQAAARPDWRDKRVTPAMMAAVGTTMNDLIGGRFADAQDQIAALYLRRQAAHHRALAAAFPDVTVDDLDRTLGPQEDHRAAIIGAFVGAALFTEAASRLEAGPGVSPFGTVGEIPADINTPSAVVGDLVRVANGAPVDAAGNVAPPGSSLDGRVPTWDYTDDLAQQIIVQQAPDVTVTYTWTVGDPQRPFEPHQLLDGATATNDTYWTVFAKDPGDWPEGDAWMPGDHDGCQCDLEAEYGEPGDE